jgi:predicted small secreted protein
MIRRLFIIVFLCIAGVCLAGCNTVGGAAKGASDGAKKDYEQAKKTDAWLQENLW